MAEEKGTDVMLVSPQESKYWEIVQAVHKQFRRGVATTRTACELAGVDHSTYYRAMKSRYVQMQRTRQIRGLIDASVAVVEENWLSILHNVAAIAAGKDASPRDAVPAARFMKDVYDDLKRDAEAESAGSESDAAHTFLEQFVQASNTKKRYKARRKRGDVEEEIEIEFPSESETYSRPS